jgi:5-methylcytosine-specific restriction endonuclease McrA
VSTKIPAQIAAQVARRAAGRCEYCHAPQIIIGQAFHIDHIIPRFADGKSILENLCLACSHCNIAKSEQTTGVDPRTRKKTLLFNPRQDIWEDHFSWSNDWRRLIGRTPVGRATIVMLDMNAKRLQQARIYWRVVGLIP